MREYGHAVRRSPCADHGPAAVVYAAFYADCVHEIRPVTEGHRVCLVYNLILDGAAAGETVLPAPDYADHVELLSSLLADWSPGTSGAPEKIVWLMEYDYSQAGLSFAGLKHVDAAVGRLLRDAAERTAVRCTRRSCTSNEEGIAEYDESSFGGRGPGRVVQRWLAWYVRSLPRTDAPTAPTGSGVAACGSLGEVVRAAAPPGGPTMTRPAPAAVPIHYPSSDGKPMAENDAQRNAIMYGIGALTRHFRDRRDVYVYGDLLIYYKEGNPRVSIAPDVFVVFGVEKRERPNYKLWEERRAPAFVLEVASPSTWRDDLGRKRSVYARLGVREYCRYDPAGEHLPARLEGERLTPSGYVRQPALTALDGTLTLRSETLDLELRAAPGRELRFRDPATGSDLRSHDEEAEGRLAAEARVAELEAMLRERSG